MALTCLLATALRASAQWIEPASIPAPSFLPPTSGSGDSVAPVISADGRYVLFASTANNLVAMGNTNAFASQFPARLNAYLRDRTNGTTTLISINLAGDGGGNGDSVPITISTNGQYVLFESSASNLIPSDTNKTPKVFMRDAVRGTTLLVSANTNGGVPLPWGAFTLSSRSATMTPDGHYVAFTSNARDLVPGQSGAPGIPGVFVRDITAGTNALASPPSSESPEITPDGHYVAYYGNMEIHVRDLWGGGDTWASSGALTALQATFTGVTKSVAYNHRISDDGQFVAYQAHAASYTVPLAGLVLRYNLQSGVTEIVATNASVPLMAQGVGPSQVPFRDQRSLQMTPDGQRIVFLARTYAPASTNTMVLLWNALDGGTALVSADLSNALPATSECSWPSIDPGGRFVLFVSSATNLVTNACRGDYHLYVRDLQSGTSRLVDVDTNGIGGGLNAAATPSMSDDGRFVVFESGDNQLVPGDGNRAADVFVRDTVTDTTELVSRRHPNLPCDAPDGPSILSPFGVSADARFVAFASEAANLVGNDTNGTRDVFVRDTLLGTNLLVSVNLSGTGSGNGPSGEPALSADGRYVVFTSSASDLVAGDTNRAQDVFIRDLGTGVTTCVSVNTNGTGPGNGPSYAPVIGSDGRRVLFRSKATDLAPPPPRPIGGTNDCLFLRDLQAQATFQVSTAGGKYWGIPSATMTPDGRYVAFVEGGAQYYLWDSQVASLVYSNATSAISIARVTVSPDGKKMVYASPNQMSLLYVADCVSNINSSFAIYGQPVPSAGMRFSADGQLMTYVSASVASRKMLYLRDFNSGTNSLIASLGAETGACGSPSLSPDGRFVAFRSFTNNISGDTNGLPDLLLYDRQAGATILLSVSPDGSTTGQSWPLTPVFSADGQTLVFQSWGSDLVPQDFNQTADIFMVRLFSSAPIPLFSAQVIPGATPGQQPTISWPVLPGKSYRLQSKSALTDGAWQDIIGGITILGSKGYFQDPAPAPDQRFYRVVAF